MLQPSFLPWIITMDVYQRARETLTERLSYVCVCTFIPVNTMRIHLLKSWNIQLLMVSSTHQRTNLALNFLTRQLLLSPFAIFLESLKMLFSYMMKSIFLENKYLLFYKESFVCHHQRWSMWYLVNNLWSSARKVYCNTFVQRMHVSK